MNNRRTRWPLVIGAATFLGSTLAAVPSFAQDRIIEEILVTARKREEVLTDVPASITVLNGAQLDEVRRKTPDLDRIAELNNEFHQELYAAAGNRRLNRILISLIEPTLVIRTFQHYSDEALRRSARQHLEIVQLLESADAEGAEAVMRNHVLAARHEFRHIV
jgi:DNA-binding GntR family transcriptional regulator